jgi:hypothetical protein
MSFLHRVTVLDRFEKHHHSYCVLSSGAILSRARGTEKDFLVKLYLVLVQSCPQRPRPQLADRSRTDEND